MLALFALAGCDPGVRMGWTKDFDGPVDTRCIENALRTVSPDVKRDTYVSEGGRGFPAGTNVTQFYYPDPVTYNSYMLDIAPLPNGKTHFVHIWTKLGTDVPPNERAQVLPLLERANNAVARICGLSFEGTDVRVSLDD